MDVSDLGHRLFATLDAHDWERLDTLVADDLVVQLGSTTDVDYAQWRDNLQRIYAAFPEGRHVIYDHAVDGRRFVTRCRFEGTHRGPLWDFQPTGRRVSVSVIHIDYFRQDLLAEHHGQLDLHGLLEQLGEPA